MMESGSNFRVAALIYANRALRGKITPAVRAVGLRIGEASLRLTFYYERPPTELELELVSIAGTELTADYPAGIAIESDAALERGLFGPASDEVLLYRRLEVDERQGR